MLEGVRRRATSTFSAGGWLPIVHRAPSRRGHVAITFDDGPTPRTTPRLLDLLRSRGAAATFFVSGRRAEAHPDLIRAIVEAGFGVYAHGYDHVRLDELSARAALEELVRTERVLARWRPAPVPYLVRLPYGSGHRSARIHRLLRAWNPHCQVVHWRYDFKDFRLAEGCADLAALGARCDAAVARAFADPRFVGSVVLMHEAPFDAVGALVPEIAPALLERLLDEAGRRGLAATGASPRRAYGVLGRFVRTVPME